MTTPRLFGPPAADKHAKSDRADAFAEIYHEYFPRVFAYIYGRVRNVQLTEDLVADAFEKAYVKVNSLRNTEAFSTWLFTIARNVIISHARKYSRETVVDPEVMREIAPSSANVENEILMREELKDIAQLVRQLPPREQEIISLKFDAELSNTQIAQIMDLSEPNIRVILFRSLRKLRQMMGAAQG
jgi:RNA polymerase sigma factor (sigma-70 family)